MSTIEKMPIWLRYLIAIPFGILISTLVGIIFSISNLIYSDPDSIWNLITSFIFKNGVNFICFFYGINVMLPKHKFIFTITLSIIFGIIYSIIQGMNIITSSLTIEYIFAFIEVILSLVISCYFSFKNKFD